MAGYAELNALPPSAFLKPENFRTAMDTPSRCEEQYRKGSKIASEAKCVGVGAGGTWFANMKSGGYLTTYEGIGYHSGTADLWRGLLECENVAIHRGWLNPPTMLKANGIFLDA